MNKSVRFVFDRKGSATKTGYGKIEICACLEKIFQQVLMTVCLLLKRYPCWIFAVSTSLPSVLVILARVLSPATVSSAFSEDSRKLEYKASLCLCGK